MDVAVVVDVGVVDADWTAVVVAAAAAAAADQHDGRY